MNLYNKDLLLLSDFSYWQSKKLYTQLMEKFINVIIDGQKFEEEFYQIWRFNRDKDFIVVVSKCCNKYCISDVFCNKYYTDNRIRLRISIQSLILVSYFKSRN